ncbi:MAG: hypothetical protein JO157_04490 [Acetobacteraceae bacterium]|nr:hypothetical protein [Acetobacteraceae bacterium]
MTMKKHILAASAIGFALLSGAAFAAPPPARTRGTIENVSADALTLDTRGGQKVEFKLTPDTKYASVTQAQIGDIQPDSYVGVTAVPQPDGMLRAMEVHVFAPSMRGVGDGHYPWDLGENTTMTNGAVGALQGTSGRTMQVQYKGGEKQIMVPEDASIVAVAPADASIMKPGAHAMVLAPKGASDAPAAVFVLVGVNGLKPPM